MSSGDFTPDSKTLDDFVAKDQGDNEEKYRYLVGGDPLEKNAPSQLPIGLEEIMDVMFFTLVECPEKSAEFFRGKLM